MTSVLGPGAFLVRAWIGRVIRSAASEKTWTNYRSLGRDEGKCIGERLERTGDPRAPVRPAMAIEGLKEDIYEGPVVGWITEELIHGFI